MKYVKIKSDSIKEKGGDLFTLRAKSAIKLDKSVSLLRFPLEIEGDTHTFGIRFELEKELSEAGAILLGASLDGNEVTASIMALDGLVSVKKGGSVLVGKLYEKVLFFKERL
jgi:hypothetical protein